MHTVYLASLSYRNSSALNSPAQLNPSFFAIVSGISAQAQIEVRVGFFGLCVAAEHTDWHCDGNTSILAQKLDKTSDPLNLLWIASRFKDQVFLSVLMSG